MSSVKYRVVVVDDDERVRRDFSELLLLEPDMDVVGLVADGATATEFCDRIRPDVVVMDIRMPLMNGIEATQRLRANNSEWCKVLVVTTFDLDEYVLGAARAGASGFLLKDQAPEELARAVRAAASGDAIVSPRATARLLQEFVVRSSETTDAIRVLTDREIDMVKFMAKGLSNEDIAREAFVSLGTVKTHVSNILAKLTLQSRIQIVVWAYENGVASSHTQTKHL
jgi:DNA-binding NarL/FixJ family response regulator